MVWKSINITLSKVCRCSLNLFFINWLRFIATLVFVVAFVGCTTTTSMTQSRSNDFEDNSLSEDEALEAIFSSTPTNSAIGIPENPVIGGSTDDPLTLHDVLNIAFNNNPTFAEFAANRELARSAVLEAVAWKNPEFHSNLRYITGDGDDIEYELGVSQRFELPSKRRARREAAAAIELVAEQEETSYKVILHAEVTKAYRTVTYRDAMITLELQNLELAKEIVAVVKKRINAGEARPIEATRARVEELKAKKQIQSAKRLRNISRKSLNALCGGTLPSNFNLLDSLPRQFELANADQVLAQAQVRHPELRRLVALKQQKALELNRERISWHPDLSPGVGFEKEADEDSYIVSMGLEIPLWNKNQGGIAKAKAELQQIEAQILKIKQDIVRDVDLALETYTNAIEQIRAFGELRSAAADALKTETFLYEQGEVDFITLLDARKTAQETESEFLAALYNAHLSRIELEQTIGISGDTKF